LESERRKKKRKGVETGEEAIERAAFPGEQREK
jgi:hypothetical protein